ncbi:polysaccharide deacetylase family protein [Kiritimatiellaeota bacterium B1221]|nr:polysaccharide deacetylase family protein [Kiritimatiellaeota bacterium B1221]
MKVVQCWDDGITADIRLIEILRKYNATATFNLNAARHSPQRKPGWEYKGTQVTALGGDELVSVYEGFTIANHSLNHPHLEAIPVEEARYEISENRKQLQDIFQQPIDGFAYPYGTYNDAVKELLKEEGHVYGRTVKNALPTLPAPEGPFAFHPTCKFNAEDFQEKFEQAKTQGGVFYFWGHSYELITEKMWEDFDACIAGISADPDCEWVEICDLFA